MTGESANTFSKKERLCGKTNISNLLGKGRYGNSSCLKYCYVRGNGLDFSRILVSVPKRSFKRAVKRNLLKRRIRESYRLQKSILGEGCDIMFIYTSREILPFSAIYSAMGDALRAISGK